MAHGLRHLIAFTLCAVVSFGTTAALANSKVNVQVFRPSPHPGDLINVEGANVPDDSVWTTSLMMTYGKNPLVFVWSKDVFELGCPGGGTACEADQMVPVDLDGDGFNDVIDTATKRDEVIQDQLTLDIMGSYSLFKWIDVGIALPSTWSTRAGRSVSASPMTEPVA